jgi:hypothetical protein
MRALARVVRVEVLRGMAVTVEDVPDRGLFEAPGFTGRFATEEDLAPYASDPEMDLPADFVAEAFARGDRCYALFAGAELAAYGWYARLPTRIDEHFLLHFDSSYTYMYKGYTGRAHRGKRLHAVGMCRALRAFTDEGHRGLVSYVLANNFASLKSVARMGYRIFGDVYLVRWAGRSYAAATRGCAAYGFRAEVLPPPLPPTPPLPLAPRARALVQSASLTAMRWLAMFAIYP